ncbi:MAG: sensor histidine kinase [Alphaproteobacteria bacterium]|nr:sensor histidine kinase [Alphaproteobacteria bacterium]
MPGARKGLNKQIQDLNADISGHRETERLLRADVAYKDVLLQEISHRVLNGFHLISGMLQIQARRSTDPDVRHQLELAAQRVSSMSLVHEQLYATAKDIMNVNALEYLTALTAELRRGFFSANEWRTLSLDAVADIDLPTDTMAFIGLAVTELVTNACKYAYDIDEPGIITISLMREGDTLRLAVGDDGRGLPEDFDIQRAKGLGMSIIRAQVKEMGGELEVNRQPPGVRFIIRLDDVSADTALPA